MKMLKFPRQFPSLLGSRSQLVLNRARCLQSDTRQTGNQREEVLNATETAKIIFVVSLK